jgi:hypothetical protein
MVEITVFPAHNREFVPYLGEESAPENGVARIA